MEHRPASTMIATLGGQPQVITFALDALLGRGEQIVEVVVLHLAPQDPRTRHALERLDREFPNGFYAHARRPIRLRRVMLKDLRGPMPDITDEHAADVVRMQMMEILQAEKAQGRPLHVVLAGGRRLLALMLFLTAVVHLDYADRVWHLYTPRAFLEVARDGQRMHARPEDGVRLIEVPFPRWGADFPAFRQLTSLQLGQIESPADRIGRCRQVWERLTRPSAACWRRSCAANGWRRSRRPWACRPRPWTPTSKRSRRSAARHGVCPLTIVSPIGICGNGSAPSRRSWTFPQPDEGRDRKPPSPWGSALMPPRVSGAPPGF